MSTSTLRAYLFGTLALYKGEDSLPLPASSDARSLLAYLLLYSQQSHPRSVLVGVFWPDMGEARARRALSQALWQIRRAVPEIIQANPHSINISTETALWIDVETFQSLINPNLPNRLQANLSSGNQDRVDRLRQAVGLYRADILADIYDDWVLIERESLRNTYLQSLETLLFHEKSVGRYNQALEYSLLLVQADPLQEPAHREVMRLYYALDRPEDALKQYETYFLTLKTELDLEPEAETTALVREIADQISTDNLPYLPQVTISSSPLLTDPAEPVQLTLVGREKERGELVACVESLFDQSGGVVLVEGEAGIGKTRLLEEVARDAQWRSAQVTWGYCREMEAALPFAPLVEALVDGLSPLRTGQLVQLVDQIWLQVLKPLLPALVVDLPDLAPAPTLAPAKERDRLVNALAQLLSAWGQVTPLILFLEDLHLADDDSLEVLEALAPRLRDHSVMVVGTYRGEEARATVSIWARLQALDRAGLRHRLVLGRLDVGSAAELIRRSLRLITSAPLFEERLYFETGGNPLFMLETLGALHDEGLLTQDESGNWHTPWDETTTDYGELPLPPAVERIIARRLSRLNAKVKRVIQLAAVLGKRFPFDLFQAVSGLETQELLQIVRDLVAHRFFRETPQDYQFSHDKIRQVAYSEISQPDLRVFHREVARALEEMHPDRVESLAHHYSQAQVWGQALAYNQIAGDRASAIFAHTESAVYYTQALEALNCLPSQDREQIFSLLLSREAAHRLRGERDKQLEDIKGLDELLSDPGFGTPIRRIQVALTWAAYWEAISDYPAALDAVQTAAEQAITTGEKELEHRAQLQWGRMLGHRGDFSAARRHLHRAYTLALEIGDISAQADSLNDLGVVYFNMGDYDAALDHAQRALQTCLPAGEQDSLASIYNTLGGIFHYLAEYPAALKTYQKAIDIRRAIGDRRLEVSVSYNLATVYYDSGDPHTARSILEQVCKLTQSIGDIRVEGYAWTFLGLVQEKQGDLETARQAYATGLDLRRQIGLHALAVDAVAGLARVATAQGDHQGGIVYADEVLDWLGERGIEGVGDPLLAYQGAYRALFAAGQVDRGRSALHAAYDLLMTFSENIADEERRSAYIHEIEPSRGVWLDYQKINNQNIQVLLPKAKAPLGRPLREDEWVEVTWTVEAVEDGEINNQVARRRQRLLRLITQAEEQAAVATVRHLATALGVSLSTIKRDLAALRRDGHAVRTRGGMSP